MKYFKGLFYTSAYNVGFLGGWRCGNINIDGHYVFVTDLKEFVVWKFGSYANFTSITPDYQEPILTEIEAGFCNDILLDQIRRAMSNNINPNLSFIEEPLWDNIYGDIRVVMVEQWNKLYHYKFTKHNVSLNIDSGDEVINVTNKEKFKVGYMHDIKYINKCEDYQLTENRYNYFPEITIPEHITTK